MFARIRLAFVHFQRTTLTFESSACAIAKERIQPVFTASIGARVRVAIVDVVTTVDTSVASVTEAMSVGDICALATETTCYTLEVPKDIHIADVTVLAPCFVVLTDDGRD